MKPNIVVQPDLWLSEILQKPSFRIAFNHDCASFLSNSFATSAFYYTKIPVVSMKTISLLERTGFRLIDTNITLDMPIETNALSGNTTIRFSENRDVDVVAQIARDNFVYTRFHLDNQIDNTCANVIKEQWVRNYYNGQRGDAMVVATVNEVPVGFLQLIYKQEEIIIDLIAVDQKHRRKCIAVDMIAFAMQQKNDWNKIIVGTQIANIPSIRLYERMGFRVCGSNYVFHYHTE